MSNFTDRHGRLIKIDIVDDCAYAYHNGEEIGDVMTTGPREIDERMPDLPPEITGWNVNPNYRRSGIATEMVRQLVDEVGILVPGQRDRGIGGENALTSEGHALTVHCQKLGLIAEFPEDERFT